MRKISLSFKFNSTLRNILIILFFSSLFWPNLTNVFYKIFDSENFLINFSSLTGAFNPYTLILQRSFTFIIQLLILTLFIYDLIKKNISLNINIIIKFILLILVYSLTLNIFYFKSLDYIFFIDYYYNYLFNLSTAIIIFNYLKNNKLLMNIILQLFVYLSVILSLQIIFGIFSVTNIESQRITLLGWKENELSLLLSFGYAILTSFISDKKYLNHIIPSIHITFSLILLNAVLFIGTRASIFVFGFILIIIFLSLLKQSLNRNQKIILLVTNITYYISKTTSHKTITERFFEDNFTNFGGRLEHWLHTLKLANENAPFGIGIENYYSKIFELFGNDNSPFALEVLPIDGFIRNAGEGFFRVGMPENLILEIYVTAGFFALCFICLLIFYMYIKAFYIYYQTKKLELLIWLTPLLASILVLNIRHIKIFFAFFSLYLIKDFIYEKKINFNHKKLFFISRHLYK